MQPCSPTRSVGQLDLVATTPEDAVTLVLSAASQRDPAHFHLVNAYTVVLSEKRSDYLAALRSGVLLPDGKPLTWVSRLKKSDQYLRQVRGPWLFESTIDRGRGVGLRHFLLGSTPETLSLLQTRLTEKYEGAVICGSYSPPFAPASPEELAERDSRIRDSRADIIWVGLGTPKQDFEGFRLSHAVGLPSVAVGAAFDFSAGTKRTAPGWMTRTGTEWLFRLISEPRRLWRRYLLGNVSFIRIAISDAAKDRAKR